MIDYGYDEPHQGQTHQNQKSNQFWQLDFWIDLSIQGIQPDHPAPGIVTSAGITSDGVIG